MPIHHDIYSPVIISDLSAALILMISNNLNDCSCKASRHVCPEVYRLYLLTEMTDHGVHDNGKYGNYRAALSLLQASHDKILGNVKVVELRVLQ